MYEPLSKKGIAKLIVCVIRTVTKEYLIVSLVMISGALIVTVEAPLPTLLTSFCRPHSRIAARHSVRVTA